MADDQPTQVLVNRNPDAAPPATASGDRLDTAQQVRAGNPHAAPDPVRHDGSALLSTLATNNDDSFLPKKIGPFQVVGEIARGGIGVIYRVHDPDLGRDLAVKVLQQKHLEQPLFLRRFLDEVRINSRLHHPGVVPIYHAGRLESGQPYFAMKLVEGLTLASLLTKRGEPVADRAKLLKVFVQACETIAYAHSQTVIHRDLKPSNIMVGAFGEVQVMDWGLAKYLPLCTDSNVNPRANANGRDGPVLAAPPSPTATSIIGTPAYMAPEQANGHDLDERCDVFGLGAILCEILTGAPPYASLDNEHAFQDSRQGKLTDAFARLDRSGADPELILLAKNCLAPDRSKRPRTAGELAWWLSEYQVRREDRFREAELRRVEIETRAVAERKYLRHKSLMTTALLIALIMVISAGALNYRQRAREAAQAVLLHQERANHEEERVAILSEQVQKQRDAELRIAKALQVANQLERKALDDPNDPAKWAEAMAAARQARELLELFPGAGELHVRTADLLRKLETGSATALAREADQKMLAKLERVRLDKAEVRDDRFNYEQADVAYACAFREFGIDIGPLDVAESARRIRATTIPVELTAAIDDWATMRKLMGRGGFSFSARLFNVARLADPHPWRNRLRTAVEKDDGPELLELTRSAPTMDPLPSTWVILANGLESTGQPNAAVDLLVRAQSRFPTDFWINHELGMACMNLEPPDYDRAIRYFTVAVALRATSPGANVNLGFALVRKGKYADAIASFDKAIALQPTYAQAHANRGYALTQLGRFDEAINAVTKAIELQPKNAGSHYLLGKTLQENGDTKGAVEPLRQAVAMRPKSDLYQSQLAKALSDLGDHSGAAAAAREAAQLVPKAEYFTLLGNALAALGDRDGAADAYNVAVCLSPNSGVVYYNLANLYAKDKDFVRAVELFDEALRHRPDYAEALCNRGLALRYLGRFRESVDSLRRGHELGSRRPDWRYRSSAWLATAMRLAKLDESLQAHLRGEQLSRNALELIAFGDLTYEYRSQPHGALRFYHAAMAVQPDVLRSPDSFLRFKAARAAIAAATGNGQEPALPAPEQIELFKVAEMWLSELASEWVTAVAKGSMSSQDAVAALGSIRNDPVFAAIRNERDLAKLPIECQHTWRRGSANLDQALSRIREIPAKP